MIPDLHRRCSSWSVCSCLYIERLIHYTPKNSPKATWGDSDSIWRSMFRGNVCRCAFTKLDSQWGLSFIWLIIALFELHSWESCNLYKRRLTPTDHLGFVGKSILVLGFVGCCVGLTMQTEDAVFLLNMWWAQHVTDSVAIYQFPNSCNQFQVSLLWYRSFNQ